MSYLDIVSYLKSERICIVSSLLQQGVMHVVQGGLVVLRVDLYTLDPDVLPEAQAHHVQVIATVAEGTRQLHKHCGTHIIDLPSFITTWEGKGSVEVFMILPFLSPKSFVSSLTTPSVKCRQYHTYYSLYMNICGCKEGTYQLSPHRTRGPHSLSSPGRGSAVTQKKGERLSAAHPVEPVCSFTRSASQITTQL